MSMQHILSAWDLSDKAKLTEFPDKPLRAEAAFEVMSGISRYLLFAFPSDRQESVSTAITLATRALKKSIPSIVPVKTKTDKNGHADGSAFWVLYPHEGSPITGAELLKNLTFATQLGEQFAKLPMGFPITEVEYPPSNLFSPVFQQSLLGLITDEHDLETILEVNLYLQRNFEAVLPWLDQEFAHGDLHPGNMYRSKDAVLFHDWEYARRELCLYDAVFLIGCLGFESISNLTSDWVLEFIRAHTESRPISWLAAENAFALLICSRMHWLHLWLSLGEQKLIEQEQAYIKALLGKIDDVNAAWNNVWTLKKPTQKWVVTDAVIPPVIKTWLASNSLEKVAVLPFEEWPLVMIALGKNKRLSEMIRWVDQLVDDWFQGELKAPLEVLTQMMANLSLDLARNLQQAGLFRLKAMLSWMQEEAPKEECLWVAQAYVQRNISMMLGDAGLAQESYDEIEVLENIWLEHPDHEQIAEELGRACAGGMVTALTLDDKDKGLQYFSRLDELLFKFPESEKIKTAFQVSKKQYER